MLRIWREMTSAPSSPLRERGQGEGAENTVVISRQILSTGDSHLKSCRWCQREILDDTPVCPHPDCGRSQQGEGQMVGKIPAPPPPVTASAAAAAPPGAGRTQSCCRSINRSEGIIEALQGLVAIGPVHQQPRLELQH